MRTTVAPGRADVTVDVKKKFKTEFYETLGSRSVVQEFFFCSNRFVKLSLASCRKWNPQSVTQATIKISSKNLFDDFPVYIGQAKITTLETIRESFMVDAEEVKHRSV